MQRLNTVINMQASRFCASAHTALKLDTTDFMTSSYINYPPQTDRRVVLLSKSLVISILLLVLSYITWAYLTLSWRRPLPYRNQSIDLLRKSMDWFLYDNGLRHERVRMICYYQKMAVAVTSQTCITITLFTLRLDKSMSAWKSLVNLSQFIKAHYVNFRKWY